MNNHKKNNGFITKLLCILICSIAFCTITYGAEVISKGDIVIELINKLQDNSPYIRANAANKLGEISDKRAVDPLIRVLKDKNPLVRENALIALGKLNEIRSADAVAALLTDAKLPVRLAAIKSISMLNATSKSADIKLLLKDANETVRAEAITTLAMLKDVTTIPEIINLLHDPSIDVVKCAISYLAETKDAIASAALLGEFKTADPDIGAVIVRSFAVNKINFDAVISATTAKDARIRIAAYMNLLNYSDPRVFELNIAGIHDPDSNVRAIIADHLASLGGRRTIEPLAELANDTDKGVQQLAIYGLGITNDSSALPYLRSLLKDESEEIKLSTIDSILMINDVDAALDLIPMYRDKSDMVRQRAIEALVSTDDSRAVPTLIESLQDTNEDIRYSAVYGLQGFNDKRAISSLRSLLQIEKKSETRMAIAKCLYDSQDTSELLLKELLSLTENIDIFTKIRAIAGLSGLEEDKWYQQITKLIDDEYVSVIAMGFAYDLDNREKLLRLLELLKPISVNRTISALCIKATGGDKSAQQKIMNMAKEGKLQSRIFDSFFERNGKEYINEIISMLHSDDPSLRFRAITIISLINDSVAYDAMVESMYSTDVAVSSMAVRQLAWLHDDRTVEILKIWAFDKDISKRSWAARLLGDVQSDKAIDTLIRMLENENDASSCMNILKSLNKYQSILIEQSLLEKYSRATDIQFRASILEALGNTNSNSKETQSLLILALSDADERIRVSASYALGKIQQLADYEGIITLLNNNNSKIRLIAVITLGITKLNNCPEQLMSLLDDQIQAVRDETLFTIGKLRGDIALSNVKTLLDTKKINLKTYIKYLAIRGDEECINEIKFYLADPSPTIKVLAINSLGKYASQDDVQVKLKDLLDSGAESNVRASALSMLNIDKYINNKATIDKYMSDNDTMVRTGISTLLLKDENVWGTYLLEVMAHGSVEAKISIARAITKMPSNIDVLNGVKALLQDENPWCRRAIKKQLLILSGKNMYFNNSDWIEWLNSDKFSQNFFTKENQNEK